MQTASGGPIKRQKDGYRYIPDEKNGGWDRISDNSMADVFATVEFTPKKTKVGSSITRKQSAPSKTYRSAYNPDDIIKGFNALTLGGLNNLSPTQWARRYYDLNKLLISQIPGSKRTMTWSGFVNNWLNGNNGLVSEKFAEEHPYWSMGINGVGDAVALGGLANANKVKQVGDIAAKHGGDATKVVIDVAKNSSKPFNWRNYRFLGDSRFYSDLDDAGYKTLMSERQSGNYPLTFTERKNYITGLKKDIQKGVDYAINEAKTNVRAPLKRGKEIEYTFDGGRGWRIEPYSPEDIQPQQIHYGTLRATKKYGQTPWEGGYGAFQNKEEGLFFPFRDKPNTLRTHSMFQDVGERISTGAHETRHTVQKYFDIPLVETRHDLPGTYGRYTNRKLPLDFKKKINEYINDAQTAGEWEGSLGEMDAELTGWSAQHGFPRYSQMNPQQKAQLHDLFQKRFGGNTDYKNYGEISSLLRQNPDYNTSLQYSKILDDSKIGQIIQGLETLGYRKHGGKMNVLEFLKNGSGIHIKEKNKGKFTSYCGGKVTDECIQKGKNSSNPAIRKRATFAANARKWKHKEGGSIEKLEKGSWIKNSLSFLNESGLGKTLIEGGLSFLQSSSQNKSIAGATDVAKAELDKEKQEASDYALQMATKKAQEMQLIDPNNPNAFGGSIVQNYIRQQLYNEYLNSINQDIANRKAQLDMQSQQMQSENTSGAISGIIQSGLGVVGNLLGGKKDTSSTNSTIYNGTSSSTKSIVQPKLTSNKWTPSTSLSNPVLGNNAQGSMPNYTSLLNVKK